MRAVQLERKRHLRREVAKAREKAAKAARHDRAPSPRPAPRVRG